MARLDDFASYDALKHFLQEHPSQAWAGSRRPSAIRSGPDCDAAACPLATVGVGVSAADMVAPAKKAVYRLLDERDTLEGFRAGLPAPLAHDLSLFRQFLTYRAWLDITGRYRTWGEAEGSHKHGVALLNLLVREAHEFTLSEIAERLDCRVGAVSEAVNWWVHDYRLLHDKTLPFVRTWRGGEPVIYQYNPGYEFRRGSAEPLKVKRATRVCLGWNLWIGGEFPRVILGMLPKDDATFLPFWPEDHSDLIGVGGFVAAYDRYAADQRSHAREFRKLWWDPRERPPDACVAVLRQWVRSGGRLVGLHDGGFQLAAELLGVPTRPLQLDWDREVVVRDAADSRKSRLGTARNNFISVVSGGALAPTSTTHELVPEEKDRDRMNDAEPFVVGFGAPLGDGFVTGWTFIAGPPSQQGELGQTDEAFGIMRTVLEAAFG